MERVGILIERLQEQYQQHADNYYLIVTAQMLLAELQQKQKVADADKKVAVIMPAAGQSMNHLAVNAIEQKQVASVNNVTPHISNNNGAATIAPVVEQNPVREIPAVEAVNEIVVPHDHGDKAASIDREKEKERYRWAFDPVAEVPTLAHQDKVVYELNEVMKDSEQSLNERLRVEKFEVASLLKEAPIRDLRKAIGINDRYLFLSELFRGDETMYERSIKTINDFKILAEAEYWIQRELKTKIGWNDSSEAVRLFDQLVRRRFA